MATSKVLSYGLATIHFLFELVVTILLSIYIFSMDDRILVIYWMCIISTMVVMFVIFCYEKMSNEIKPSCFKALILCARIGLTIAFWVHVFQQKYTNMVYLLYASCIEIGIIVVVSCIFACISIKEEDAKQSLSVQPHGTSNYNV